MSVLSDVWGVSKGVTVASSGSLVVLSSYKLDKRSKCESDIVEKTAKHIADNHSDICLGRTPT